MILTSKFLRFLGLDIPHGGEAVDNPTIDRPVGRLVGDHVDVKHVDVKHVDDIVKHIDVKHVDVKNVDGIVKRM